MSPRSKPHLHHLGVGLDDFLELLSGPDPSVAGPGREVAGVVLVDLVRRRVCVQCEVTAAWKEEIFIRAVTDSILSLIFIDSILSYEQFLKMSVLTTCFWAFKILSYKGPNLFWKMKYT